MTDSCKLHRSHHKREILRMNLSRTKRFSRSFRVYNYAKCASLVTVSSLMKLLNYTGKRRWREIPNRPVVWITSLSENARYQNFENSPALFTETSTPVYSSPSTCFVFVIEVLAYFITDLFLTRFISSLITPIEFLCLFQSFFISRGNSQRVLLKISLFDNLMNLPTLCILSFREFPLSRRLLEGVLGTRVSLLKRNYNPVPVM